MIQNKLFRECLEAIPEERMAEFELSHISWALGEDIIMVARKQYDITDESCMKVAEERALYEKENS